MSTTTLESPAAVTGAEKRTSPRHRVLKGGKITFGDFVFVRECSVRDMSPDGCRISVAGAHEIPNEFYLVVHADHLMRRARVVWRRKDVLGIKYDGEVRNLATDPDPRLKQFRMN